MSADGKCPVDGSRSSWPPSGSVRSSPLLSSYPIMLAISVESNTSNTCYRRTAQPGARSKMNPSSRSINHSPPNAFRRQIELRSLRMPSGAEYQKRSIEEFLPKHDSRKGVRLMDTQKATCPQCGHGQMQMVLATTPLSSAPKAKPMQARCDRCGYEEDYAKMYPAK
jgi:ribosomal protein L37E